MLFSKPTSVSNAMASSQVKTVLTNLLTNDELQTVIAALPDDVRQNVLALAGVYDARILEALNEAVQKVASGTEDFATARMEFANELRRLGAPEELMAEPRLNLMLGTQVDFARGDGQKISGSDPDVLQTFPAWEYRRLGSRRVPREWFPRWNAAKSEAGDATATNPGSSGVMVARKDSGLWAALGDGAGGYTDVFGGRDFAPFAFNSGMGMINCSRSRAIALGVVTAADKITPPAVPDFSKMTVVPVDLRLAALRAAVLAKFPTLQFKDGVLTSA